MYVTVKGKVFNFCSSKCDKNMLKLGRSNRRVGWTKTYRKEKDARLKLLKEGVGQQKIRELEKKAEKKEQEAAESEKVQEAGKPAAVEKPSTKPEPKKAKGKDKK